MKERLTKDWHDSGFRALPNLICANLDQMIGNISLADILFLENALSDLDQNTKNIMGEYRSDIFRATKGAKAVLKSQL